MSTPDIDIYPVILAHSFDEYVARLELVEKSTATWVQIDIMDGQFVPNISVMPSEFMSIVTPLKLEAHLMVGAPEQYFSDLSVASVQRVLLHVESFESDSTCVALVKRAADYFPEVGLVLSPQSTLNPEYLSLPITVIQVMGVHPGQSGQAMLGDTADRVKKLREMGWRGTICVDGGVHEGTIAELIAAGADRFVMASHLFAGNALATNLQRFNQLVTEGL
jgi:ribulose-phosphate 3-epimerase